MLKVAHAFDLLCRDVREPAPQLQLRDPLVRDRIATLAAEIEVGRRLMIHCAELATERHDAARDRRDQQGVLRRADGALRRSRARHPRAARRAVAGRRRARCDNGRFEQGLRHSLMWVISIGTNEIQRSLIAQRGLGLPR